MMRYLLSDDDATPRHDTRPAGVLSRQCSSDFMPKDMKGPFPMMNDLTMPMPQRYIMPGALRQAYIIYVDAKNAQVISPILNFS